jgi:hypothetical protein
MKKHSKKLFLYLLVVMLAFSVASCTLLDILLFSFDIAHAVDREAKNKKTKMFMNDLSSKDDVDTFTGEGTDTIKESEKTYGTATIIFESDYSTVTVENSQMNKSSENNSFKKIPIQRIVFVEILPKPEDGNLNSQQFPAGKELNIRLYILLRSGSNTFNTPGHRRRGIFKCPPLEAGKTYKLWFEDAPLAKDRDRGAGRLILTDANVKELSYKKDKKTKLNEPLYKYIHIQDIPPLVE